MKNILICVVVVFSSNGAFASEECYSWNSKPIDVVGTLSCEIDPSTSIKPFTLHVLKNGLCKIKELGSIREIGSFSIGPRWSEDESPILDVYNENGTEILRLDLTSHLLTKKPFFFRLSFPKANAASTTAIVSCTAQ